MAAKDYVFGVKNPSRVANQYVLLKAKIKKIIKEELFRQLKEQQLNFNTKVLDKVMSRNRLGRFKKCNTGGGYVGLKRNCMGKEVAELQALVNQWFKENEKEEKMLSIDGLYGKNTAEALGFVYNTSVDPDGPVQRNTYDVSTDRIIAKGSNVEQAIAAVRRYTAPKSMVARASEKDPRVAALTGEFPAKGTATPPGMAKPPGGGLEDISTKTPAEPVDWKQKLKDTPPAMAFDPRRKFLKGRIQSRERFQESKAYKNLQEEKDLENLKAIRKSAKAAVAGKVIPIRP